MKILKKRKVWIIIFFTLILDYLKISGNLKVFMDLSNKVKWRSPNNWCVSVMVNFIKQQLLPTGGRGAKLYFKSSSYIGYTHALGIT